MTEESTAARLARLEERVARYEERESRRDEMVENHHSALFGERADGQSGLIRQVLDQRAEMKYLRWVYALAAALIVAPVTLILNKLGIWPTTPKG